MIWKWWMTLLVILAVLVLIGLIPVGVLARYNQDGTYLAAKLGLLKIRILPKKEGKKKKPKKEKPKKEKKKKKAEAEKPGQTKKKSGLRSGGVGGILELLDILSDTLGNLRRKLRVNELMLHVTYKGSDPARAAINYGRAWAAIGVITPCLERLFVIKKRDIQPVLDYDAPQLQVDVRAEFTMTIGRILALGLRAGLKFLKLIVNKKKNDKGGAENESSSV